MPLEIKIISGMGINCYLARTGEGYLLIDTGLSFTRKNLLKELENADCRPGDLQQILITHGDLDHIGNAAFLRKKYATRIAMHAADEGMAEFGDMDWSRKKSDSLLRKIFRAVARVPKSDRFKADVFLEDGDDLSGYGMEARVVHLPGHSGGSIGVLTPDGDLFCGDMFMNEKSGPRFGFGDPADFQPSLEKLKSLEIHTVYPGHGAPFQMETFYRQPSS